ncbi:GspE/PulE family protein [Kiritimatiella glycovorans]|uniref:Type IV fimbrial assembly protein n=1 Tax=Kiritimatiella glycovorans TaxID=1307763 RepID=A0A0G3EFH4_9BACT|nr:ATPase, T2SS/T4P/T4SS family [Kiritimatiella glycovorans]AKJ63545.1 type IV fimbrial assembly protein [Kiritimatiella glycovorans]
MPDSTFQIEDPLLQQLHDEGKLRPEQCEEIFDEHERTGKSIRNVVLDMEALKEEDYLKAVANHLGCEMTHVDQEIDPKLIKSVPVGVARMYNVIPYRADDETVTLAVCDVPSPAAVDELLFVLSRDVSFVVAPHEDIEAAMTRYYGEESGSVNDLLSALESELEETGDRVENRSIDADTVDLEDLQEAASSAPVIRFVNLVLYQAVKDRASDVHFEPFEDEFKIRYRVDGALYEMSPPPKHLALPIISRVKVIAGLNIAEHRLPQDGRIQLNVAGSTIDFRVSSLPTQFGESVVLRILDKTNVSLDLDNIGLPEDIYDSFTDDIEKPNGIIIATGPTGSGKTTTLYSAMRRVNSIDRKLLTAEDPVEYDMEGIIQVPINEGIGLSFAGILRNFLRQDPDIILVGEIRDLETAQIAIQASLTGHLVFSTLHTNDAPGAITRLIDMGAEPFLISSTLEGVIAQRLIRTICPGCKKPYTPEDALLEELNLSRADVGDNPFYFGEGCNMCNFTGYRGRRGIFEYLRMNEPLRELVNQRSATVKLRNKATELGMRTLREDGIRCILDGYTTPDEVLRYT